MIKYLAILALVVFTFGACTKTKGTKIPSIGEVSVHPQTVRAGNPDDKVFISFKVADGDRDLGQSKNSGKYDIYLRDKRTDSIIGFYLPEIPKEIKDGKDGIEGHCTVIINAAFLQLRPDHPELDTLQYEMYITDLAGNESNRLDTWDIYLVKP